MRAAGFFAPLVVALAISSVAEAAPTADSKRAAQSFAVGKSAFARGDYAGAAAAFEQAASYAPHPAALLNAAEAWELAGNHVHAAQVCDRVLAMPDLEPKYRQAATQQLTRLGPHVGTLEIKAPDGTHLSVDGERATASGRVLRVAPGAHALSATFADGDSRNENVTVAAGVTKEVDLTPAPAAAPAPSTPKQPDKKVSGGSGPPAGVWIALGVAAVSGGVATVYGLRTVDARDRFNASPTVQTRDDFNSSRLMTNVFIGVAAVSAAVGVVMWIAAPSGETKETTQAVRDAAAGVFRF
jgi:hypothetical protein